MIISPNWRAALKVTGRWSSYNPNMQNVPKEKTDASGRIVRPSLRDLYCARPGNYLVEGDYSQLELRLATLYSKDPPLVEAYASGADVHTQNAQDLLNKSNPTKSDRTMAKIFVFGGILYRGAPRTIHRQVAPGFPKITLKAVEKLIQRWDNAHPVLRQWQLDQVAQCEEQGYVEEMIAGRRYYFYMGQVEATKCLNFPIQGAAASLLNQAILRVDKMLDWSKESIIMTVHDSIICEGPDPERLAGILKECMEVEVDGIPIGVDIEVGTNWDRMEEIE